MPCLHADDIPDDVLPLLATYTNVLLIGRQHISENFNANNAILHCSEWFKSYHVQYLVRFF